jgi:hypothetical protein
MPIKMHHYRWWCQQLYDEMAMAYLVDISLDHTAACGGHRKHTCANGARQQDAIELHVAAFANLRAASSIACPQHRKMCEECTRVKTMPHAWSIMRSNFCIIQVLNACAMNTMNMRATKEPCTCTVPAMQCVNCMSIDILIYHTNATCTHCLQDRLLTSLPGSCETPSCSPTWHPLMSIWILATPKRPRMSQTTTVPSSPTCSQND